MAWSSAYPIASGDDLTQRKISPYIARTGWTGSQATQPLGDHAYKVLHYRKVATIAYDFEFGWQSVGGFGLKMPLVCQGNATDESTLPQTGPSAIGVATALHYTAALDTPANTAFVAAYQKAYGHGPSYYAEGTYVGAMFLDRALAAVHGDTSDPLALAKALRTIVLTDAPRGPVSLDAYGNPVENIYIRQVEQQGGRSRTSSSTRTRGYLSSGRIRQRSFWPTRFTRARSRRATGAGRTRIGTPLSPSGAAPQWRSAACERPEWRRPLRSKGAL